MFLTDRSSPDLTYSAVDFQFVQSRDSFSSFKGARYQKHDMEKEIIIA